MLAAFLLRLGAGACSALPPASGTAPDAASAPSAWSVEAGGAACLAAVLGVLRFLAAPPEAAAPPFFLGATTAPLEALRLRRCLPPVAAGLLADPAADAGAPAPASGFWLLALSLAVSMGEEVSATGGEEGEEGEAEGEAGDEGSAAALVSSLPADVSLLLACSDSPTGAATAGGVEESAGAAACCCCCCCSACASARFCFFSSFASKENMYGTAVGFCFLAGAEATWAAPKKVGERLVCGRGRGPLAFGGSFLVG